MKKIKLVVFLLIVLNCCSCYNYRELNQLAITSAVGIDKIEDGFLVTMQIINTVKQGSDTNTSGNTTKFIIYEKKGRTVQEAIRNVLNVSPKRVYAEHLQLLILGSDLVEKDIKDTLDLAFRDTESRKQFVVATIKDNSANELLKTITPLETINAKSIAEMLETNVNYLGTTINVTFEEMISMYISKTDSIYLPYLQLEKSKDNANAEELKKTDVDTKILVGGIAIFKENKIAKYLSNKESQYFNFLHNNINSAIETFKCDKDNYTSLEILKSKTKYKVTNNLISISISGDANINEINCNLDIRKEKNIKFLETLLNHEIEKNINDLLQYEKTLNLDIVGYKTLIYKKANNYYEQNKYDLTPKYKISVDFKIQEKGNALKVIK